MVERKASLMKPMHQCHSSQWGEWVCGVQSWKERRLLFEFAFVLIGKQTLSPKNGRIKSFSYETKASMSFILMRRKHLWCPILKRNEITMWIRVCPNWQMNLILKNGGNKSFLRETKSLMPFIEIWGVSLWCPILKRKDITLWIRVCPNRQTNFNSKKW